MVMIAGRTMEYGMIFTCQHERLGSLRGIRFIRMTDLAVIGANSLGWNVPSSLLIYHNAYAGPKEDIPSME
jgi:hypothetical protein